MARMTEADRQALARLLAAPDLPCLPNRGLRYTQPGSDTRRKAIIRRDLGRAYLEHRMLEASRFDSEVVSVRRARLRLVRLA